MIQHTFDRSFSQAIECLWQLHEDLQAREALVQLSRDLCRMYQCNGKVLIAGNGGSMADAMHFAEELTGRFRNDRRPLAALSLADPTHLSCVANDYGFEFVFSRMIEALAAPSDIVILLSTSGNSKNLILAAQAAKQRGSQVVGFLGRGGGELLAVCDLVIMAPGETTDRIQEIHMLALHIVVEAVEIVLGLAEDATESVSGVPPTCQHRLVA